MKNHKWINKSSYQWGSLGGSSSDAHTTYQCEYCNKEIDLYYNNNDTHDKVMERNGILLECSDAPDVILTGKEKKIFCFVNSGINTNWQNVLAMCEDGVCLGNHISSNEGWAKIDIGYADDSNPKHEKYTKHCPDGYELIWIDTIQVKEQFNNKSGELYKAYLKNQELGKKVANSNQF